MFLDFRCTFFLFSLESMQGKREEFAYSTKYMHSKEMYTASEKHYSNRVSCTAAESTSF
jgi:hypothetical protein